MADSGLRGFWRSRLDRWLEARLPRSRETRLNQRRIFILPTRQGWVLLLVALAIFLGGINYSNSLMLATAFLLASLFMVSMLHTWNNLSGLVVRAGRTSPAFAGDDAAFVLSFGTTARHSHEAIRIIWGRAIPVWVDLDAGREQEVRVMIPTRYRGRFRPRRLLLETRYPLGLFRAWSWLDPDMEALIYPRPEPCDYPRRAASDRPDGELPRGEGSDDFAGLREYRPGDKPRQIAWRRSARTGELVSKEFAALASHQQWLEWEAFAGLGTEERLSRLCYQVLRLHEAGQPWGLRLPGIELAPRHDDAHLQRSLEALALYGEEAS